MARKKSNPSPETSESTVAAPAVTNESTNSVPTPEASSEAKISVNVGDIKVDSVKAIESKPITSEEAILSIQSTPTGQEKFIEGQFTPSLIDDSVRKNLDHLRDEITKGGLIGSGHTSETRKTLRDSNGLLKNVNYIFDESGLVDWKKMLDRKFFGVKTDAVDQVKRQYGVKDLSELDLAKVDDYYLYIKLGGINQLANLRGYRSLEQHMDYVSDNKAVATCTMEFIPNFESDFNPFRCAGVANASLHNVNGSFKYYLEMMAENRAFIRCVRRALRINIVTEDELVALEKVERKDDAAKSEIHENAIAADPAKKGFAQQDSLKVFCDEKGISFDDIKATSKVYRTSMKSDPDTWTGFDSIPALDCYWLLSKLSEKLNKKS